MQELSTHCGLFTLGEILGHVPCSAPDGVGTDADEYEPDPTQARLRWTRLDRFHLHALDDWSPDALEKLHDDARVFGLGLTVCGVPRKFGRRPMQWVTVAQWRSSP